MAPPEYANLGPPVEVETERDLKPPRLTLELPPSVVVADTLVIPGMVQDEEEPHRQME